MRPTSTLRLVTALSCACVVGCQERPAAPSTPATRLEARAEWRGRLPCADCDVIDAQLVLQRGARDGYRLVETYRSGNAAERFIEQGRWRRDDGLLRLRGDAGSVRLYALLPDGRLQPRGMHGEALGVADEDFLVPISTEYTP